MGACGEEKSKREKNPKEGEIKVDNEIKAIDENENDKVNLKSTPLQTNNYTIKFIDLYQNKEDNETIKGNLTLDKILLDLKIRQNSDFNIEFENNVKIGIDKKNEIFENIIKEIFNNNIPEIITMRFSYTGLALPENIIEAYIDNNKIIGSAILDNIETFSIITYEIENKSINEHKYKRSDYPELTYLNSFSAYCNAKGFLYFSGGEKELAYDLEETPTRYNEFYCIDLEELNKNTDKLVINQLNNLIEERTWHSMIYVPNKYIFIVGGSNTKSVELYDMEEKKLTKDSELNELRCECTLCLVNNMYLYAFCGFLLHQDYNNSIERCNLFKENRNWEYINSVENCKFKFNPSFFGISYFQNNDLLLIGGNDTSEGERHDYIYKIGKEDNENDDIEEYKLELKEKLSIFKDKFFIPIKDNKAINIPMIIGDDIKVIILDTQNGEIIS